MLSKFTNFLFSDFLGNFVYFLNYVVYFWVYQTWKRIEKYYYVKNLQRYIIFLYSQTAYEMFSNKVIF